MGSADWQSCYCVCITDLEKIDCLTRVTYHCWPWSQWPAAIVHLTPAYSESFFLTCWVELSRAHYWAQDECMNYTGSSLLGRYYKWVTGTIKMFVAWLHWDTSLSGLSFQGLWHVRMYYHWAVFVLASKTRVAGHHSTWLLATAMLTSLSGWPLQAGMTLM